MTTLAEAVAARAKAREHEHCRQSGLVTGGIWHAHIETYEGSATYISANDTYICTDHRTPAEQRADALDAAATLWAWFEDDAFWASIVVRLYDAIQRTEVTE